MNCLTWGCIATSINNRYDDDDDSVSDIAVAKRPKGWVFDILFQFVMECALHVRLSPFYFFYEE